MISVVDANEELLHTVIKEYAEERKNLMEWVSEKVLMAKSSASHEAYKEVLLYLNENCTKREK
jgi:hypothetical protein